jgi:hypothetical protein
VQKIAKISRPDSFWLNVLLLKFPNAGFYGGLRISDASQSISKSPGRKPKLAALWVSPISRRQKVVLPDSRIHDPSRLSFGIDLNESIKCSLSHVKLVLGHAENGMRANTESLPMK